MLDSYELAEEVRKFLVSEEHVRRFLTDRDERKLLETIKLLPISSQDLDVKLDVQINCEIELAWLCSKVERLRQQLENALKKSEAEIAKELISTGASQWVVKSVLHSDPDLSAKREQLACADFLRSFIERLMFTANRRQQVAKDLVFKENLSKR